MTPVPTIEAFDRCAPLGLYALFKDVYSSGAMSETLDEKYPDFPAFEREVAGLGAGQETIALAAVLAERPVAFVLVRPRRQARLRHTAELSMGVAQDLRGSGFGRLILEAGLERVRASGRIEIVYLTVRADNGAALRLYAAAGFEALAVLARDTKLGDAYTDGILMRRFVPPSA